MINQLNMSALLPMYKFLPLSFFKFFSLIVATVSKILKVIF